MPGDRRMHLRYRGCCRSCKRKIPAGSDAIYERVSRTVRCITCMSYEEVAGGEAHAEAAESGEAAEPSSAVDPGLPGASARREYERRHASRQERVLTEHRRLGKFILMVSADPQSTRAWDTGAVGEERLGAGLNKRADRSLRLLHDRQIPGSRTNIDHLAVTPTGVFVIDAKRYRGRPRLVVEGGLIRQRSEKLLVGSRDCTQLVDGLLRQVDVVRGLVGPAAAVHGVLCFVGADWPLLGGSFATRGVSVLWPRKLYPKLTANGPLSPDEVSALHRRLSHNLQPAR